MLELGKLIMAVMYVLHVFSCLWFWVSNMLKDLLI